MHKKWKLLTSLIFSLTILFSMTPAVSAQTSSLKKVPWQGKDWFLHGVNMPWIQWGCDFGSGCTWGDNGVESSAVQAKIRPEFQKLKDNNLHVVRWWLFPGLPSTNDQGNKMILTDASGKPTGIDAGVYRDIDAAVTLAKEYDLYYNFTLFSGPSALPASWRDNPDHRQALADVLGQLFARYKNEPRIFAWETFNEPEWEIFWDNQADLRTKTVDVTKRIIAAQRANTPALVNIGPAWVQLDVWKNANVDVDFYSPHYYDNMQNQYGRRDNAFSVTADQLRQEYGIDKPILLGEAYVGTDINPVERYEEARRRGYAGVWGWSLFYNSTSDRMQIDMAAAKTFASRYSDIGPSGSTTVPSIAPSPTVTKAPTATPTRTPTAVPSTTVPTATKAPAPTVSTAPSPTVSVVPQPTITEQFRTSATAPTTSAGKTMPITVKVTSRDAANVLIDVEVYNAAGSKVFQAYFPNQQFTAQQTKQFVPQWAIPAGQATGSYTVKTGIFSNDWATLYSWNNTAGTVTVGTTTVPTATPTKVPPTPTKLPPTATPLAGSKIAVYAYGYPANGVYPTLRVVLNGTTVKEFTNVRDARTSPLNFTFSRKLTTTDVVRIQFTNDLNAGSGGDRNVLVDRIVVDGKTFQSEASTTYASGVYVTNACKAGYLLAEKLSCNGYFQYKLQ